MFEIAQRFINKKCIVYTYNSQVVGVITEVTPGAIVLVNKKTTEAINFDFIMRIREYPIKKNGKEKSVVLD